MTGVSQPADAAADRDRDPVPASRLATAAGWPASAARLNGPHRPPQLLISVRSPDEIDQALAAAVDIVDLKEPRRGPLAPTHPDLWRYAGSQRLRSAASLSAALGERDDAIEIAGQLTAEFAYAKVGPSGCATVWQILGLWADVRAALAAPIELVAVAYADYEGAGCVAPEAIFATAHQADLRHCLIDTYSKDGRSSIDHLGYDRLAQLARQAHDAGLRWALAGAIQTNCLPELARRGIRPDCFGVRGAVCDTDRKGHLSDHRIRHWQESLAAWNVDAVHSAGT
jgi:hypothetical protein